jgi:hypothetical protein
MKRKSIALLLVLCFLLVNVLQVQSEVVEAKDSSPSKIYFF